MGELVVWGQDAAFHRGSWRPAAVAIVLLAWIAAPAVGEVVVPEPTAEVYYRLGVVSGGDLSVGGGAVVDGSLHGNGSVRLGGGSRIGGDISAVDRVQGETRASVSGAVVESAAAVPIPSFDAAALRARADRVVDGDLVLKNEAVDEVVFVAGTVRIQGGVSGHGALIAAGDIRWNGKAGQGTSAPAELSLIAGRDLRLGSGRSLRGVFFAGRTVHVGQDFVLEGVIVGGRRVQLGRNGSLTFVDFDQTAPTVSDRIPVPGAIVPMAQTEVSASLADDLSGVDPETVLLTVDGVDRTADATVASEQVVLPTGPVYDEGAHAVELSLADRSDNPASDSWSFVVDTVPPSLSFTEPSEPLLIDEPAPRIVLSWSDATSGVEPTSLRVSVDGNDISLRCTTTETEAVCNPPELFFGAHTAAAEVRDRAGHRATATFDFETRQDIRAPEVSLTAPVDGELLASTEVRVRGTARDDGKLSTVRVNGEEAALDGETFQAVLELAEGTSVVQVIAEDSTGKVGAAAAAVTVDSTPPEIRVRTPDDGSVTNLDTALVEGEVRDASTITEFTVAGEATQLSAGRFERQVELASGANVLRLEATDAAGHETSLEIGVSRFELPEVRITEPEDLATLTETAVTVRGTVDDPEGAVDVNGLPARVAADGSFVAEGVPVAEGGNVLTATLRSSDGAVNTASVHVVRDLTAPRVVITTPEDGAVVTSASVTVTGMVNDIVAGTVGAEDATVKVNRVPAVVRNRTFIATGVPLDLGDNVLTAVAVDASGNTGQGVARIERVEPAAVPKVEAAGGDLQEGVIRTELPLPLQVIVRDADGTPVAGRTVVFEEDGGGGHLDGGKRRIAVATDAQGLASARWTLGRRAGAQQVRATAVGIAGAVTFTALAESAGPAVLVVDSGDQQVGVAGQQLPRPLIATVTDDGFNRLGGVPVVFRVIKGGGHFGGEHRTMTVETDKDGHAVATLVLDPAEGVANNAVTAHIEGRPDGPVVSFTASGKAAGPAAETTVTGVVLDNTSRPVPGATVRIGGTELVTRTDASGQFRIDGAPVGEIVLRVDGSTVERPGVWASLAFHLTTIPGRDNDLGMPIYLLPIDVEGGLPVDERTGGVLEVPEVPGLSLEIEPGSVTFADGSKSGVVSMTVVHNDRVPMVPNFGQQPRLIVTIQPVGATFDPPAKITYPNVEGLAPGQSTDFYSFDHDLGHFVSIGPGTVSDDGTKLVADPGVGIIKAGWHCGGDPQMSTGTAHRCDDCESCDGAACQPDDSLTCDDKNVCTVNDECKDGECVALPIEIISVEAFVSGGTEAKISAKGSDGGSKSTTVPIEKAVELTSDVETKNCEGRQIKWTFPDGSELFGERVTKAFPEPGFHSVEVEVRCGDCPKTKMDQVEVIAVELQGLDVISGASMDHVKKEDTWVALKNPDFMVNLKAVVEPQVDSAGDLISWSGGEEIPGFALGRQVHRKEPRREKVTAALGPDSEEVQIWVIWSTIELKSAGKLSTTNDIQVPIRGLAFPKLGALTDEEHFVDGFRIAETAAHVEVSALIEPSGMGEILDPDDPGWKFRQVVSARGCENGIRAGRLDNKQDDPELGNQDRVPESDDRIYYIDAPTLGFRFDFEHTTERYRVFGVVAEWNGNRAADEFFWMYFARVDDDLDPLRKPRNQDTVLNQVGEGRAALPEDCFFEERP